MKKILSVLLLPPTITEFEARYLARMNRIGMGFFALHIPVLATIAWLNDTGALLAALLATTVMIGPALAKRAFTNPRALSLAYGFTAMLMGGLLVHFGQGPMQIEMHFYFFALLAMLVLFGNPLAIVVAAATVALHHLILWLVLPSSVFNYDAQVWVVAVHAAFVVLESIAACFIARSFFDNVIGLEKIVQQRTAELAGRNDEMRRVLDNVQEGLLTLDRHGIVAAERSAAADEMLGALQPGERFADALRRLDPDAGAWFDVGWTEVQEGVMPLELTLAQLPTRLVVGPRHFELDYAPIGGTEGALDRVLVVVSDITAAIERARFEGLQRELAQLFHRYAADRRGVVEFLEEGGELVERVTTSPTPELAVLSRALHTIKGNAGIFGVASVAETCHELEDMISDTGTPPPAGALQVLAERWASIRGSLAPLLDDDAHTIEIERNAYDSVRAALHEGRPSAEIEHMVASWSLEPTALRLGRVAEQSRRIAQRVGKGELDIEIRDHGVRLDPARWGSFWSSFIHVVRNAVDHGIERADERARAGKPERGRIALESRIDAGELVIAIEDDGRGIDLGALSAAAARCGIDASTPEKALSAMFHDGVTTASAVSEVSGRGIGMGAVRSACAALGGRVVTRSEPGKYTRFEFRFPDQPAVARAA